MGAKAGRGFPQTPQSLSSSRPLPPDDHFALSSPLDTARLSPLRPSWTRPQTSAKVSTAPAAGGGPPRLASAPHCFRPLVPGPAWRRGVSRVQAWKSGRYLDSLVTGELQLKMLFGAPKARSLQSAFESCSPGPDGRYGYVRPFLLAEHCTCLLLV